MPARHALSIPEILLHVSEQLQPDTEFWEERERGHPESRAAALACSARVCEGFREPALRVLWRDIPSIEVLVELVRPSAEGAPVWVSTVSSTELLRHELDVQVLVRSMRAEEWTRFQYHARFVRCCRFPTRERSDKSQNPVNTMLCQQLSIQNSGQPLLPNLRSSSGRRTNPSAHRCSSCSRRLFAGSPSTCATTPMHDDPSLSIGPSMPSRCF
ncbi:uncharacterized protein C8Q71DRAFT_180975 [Rhodofomes roseus]|uniref:Uncharacterized protein n=1 Tax=Rhodofomes roseus TaxID=34475 RepID=A0ABQ8K968_9APHY|nr:uncharacterized protein C8Q71DRAFT_180975 [Rhodofomes roseus]KAH9833396.1 hypothetical protein C8Q71DRAFT_180975 [Rhodofomes roseus]